MFTIITSLDNKKSLFAKRIQISYQKQDNIHFAIVKLKNPKRTNWYKVKETLGNSCHRIVPTIDIILPKDVDILAVDSKKYSLRLLENGLCYLLDGQSIKKRKRNATLIDLNGRYENIADILVKNFNTVRIVTNRHDQYAEYAQRNRLERGASVILLNNLRDGMDTSLFLSPDGIILKEMENTNSPIITNTPLSTNINAKVISSFQAETPNKYKGIVPNGVSEHLFQAALYNYCGVSSLSTLIPNRAMLNESFESMDNLKINLFSIDIK